MPLVLTILSAKEWHRKHEPPNRSGAWISHDLHDISFMGSLCRPIIPLEDPSIVPATEADSPSKEEDRIYRYPTSPSKMLTLIREGREETPAEAARRSGTIHERQQGLMEAWDRIDRAVNQPPPTLVASVQTPPVPTDPMDARALCVDPPRLPLVLLP